MLYLGDESSISKALSLHTYVLPAQEKCAFLCSKRLITLHVDMSVPGWSGTLDMYDKLSEAEGIDLQTLETISCLLKCFDVAAEEKPFSSIYFETSHLPGLQYATKGPPPRPNRAFLIQLKHVGQGATVDAVVVALDDLDRYILKQSWRCIHRLFQDIRTYFHLGGSIIVALCLIVVLLLLLRGVIF
jgi:hypothetical protein